jgi:NADPH-dependent 2,4-dienoyl-CoA reductase/sulfur reductase-like enzyme
METARSAALRGHAVTLYERSDRLGGQLRLAARCPSRGEFAQVYNWLERQVRKAEVKVVLGVNATASLIKEERPDIVVLATGSMPVLPEVPGADSGRVVLAHDVLKGKAEVE